MSISILEEQPDSPDAVTLIRELDDHLNQLDYPAESRHAFSVDRLVREGVKFVVLRNRDEAVGCGGVKIADDYAEVKRMYVRPQHRGLGYAKQILASLESLARRANVKILLLETGIWQKEAIALYERYGFRRRGPFAEYVEDPMSVYFEKSLNESIPDQGC
jgi:GNAT superfamily N-acetyltransferase